MEGGSGEEGWLVFVGCELGTSLVYAWSYEDEGVADACTRIGASSRDLWGRLGHSAMHGSSMPALVRSCGSSCSCLV